jgi:hypothetical protein
VLGDYSRVTLIAGDTGHLTFGRSQTTLGSGNLSSMLQRYCFNGGCRLGPCLAPFGQTSARRVHEFQAASGLPVTGIADAGVIAKLTG